MWIIFVIFVPSHAGIKDNERAVSLASRTPVVEGRAKGRAEILSAVMDTCRNEVVAASWILHL